MLGSCVLSCWNRDEALFSGCLSARLCSCVLYCLQLHRDEALLSGCLNTVLCSRSLLSVVSVLGV